MCIEALTYSDSLNLALHACTVPLWKLSGKLKTLSLEYPEAMPYFFPHKFRASGEPGTTLGDIEARSLSLSDYKSWGSDEEAYSEEAIDGVHAAIGSRTIVAALRGGFLKRLQIISTLCERPYHLFRLRILLPYWVGVEDWGSTCSTHGLCHSGVWPVTKLRPFLAYTARRTDWLDPRSSSASYTNRRLTPSDFKLMQAYFAIPRNTSHFSKVIECYLPWLAEDTALAQEVLNVWHRVVDRGPADKVKCQCEECSKDPEDP